jgi:biopolymer transport protein ExbB
MTSLQHLWLQSDGLIRSVAVCLLFMSISSWSIMLLKAWQLWSCRRTIATVLPALWQANSLGTALQRVKVDDRSQLFASVAIAIQQLPSEWLQGHPPKALAGGIADPVASTLQHATLLAQARIEGGLTWLASVGSTAPFVGLLGTVWGIYHALTSLTGSTQVVLDQVAGPVGEALIMTAAGLFVAIPAVLGYNAIVRGNRLVLAHLDGFAHTLHRSLISGIPPSSVSAATAPTLAQ